MKKLAVILLVAVMLCSLAACSNQTTIPDGHLPNSDTSALPAGVDFKLGDETYALEKWTLCPEYDTDTQIGVGLCFVQKEGVAPIVISGGSYKSLVDMTLDVSDSQLGTSNISFIAVEDAPGYAARITFEFALTRGAVLPVDGTIFHTGDNEEIAIDLSELEALPIEAAETLSPGGVAPAPDDFGKETFFGEWQLTAITFRTPETNNGIYTIDATMNISEGFEYGRELILKEDMGMNSNINLRALMNAVDELPFSIDELNLLVYSGWEYANGTLTLTAGGPAFTAYYDEAARKLLMTHSGEATILSPAESGEATQLGSVLLDITMEFIAQ